MDRKQTSLSELVRQTKPFPESPNAEPGTVASDGTATVNVNLTLSEIERLGAIAAENNVTRNNLVAYALRRFIRKYDAGKAHIVKKPATAKKP